MQFRYYAMGPKEGEEVLEGLKHLLVARGVRLAVVFGSFLEMDGFRDVDVAVYIDGKEDLDVVLELSAELEGELGLPIDVVPLQTLPPKFRLEVLTRGRTIVEEPGVYEALFSQAVDEL